MPDDPRYSLTELADLAAVTPRTVRYYISSGLLVSPGQSGPGAKYGDEDLARLRLIRRLQREHLPLAEIRRRLDGLGDDDLRALAAEPATVPADSALEYLRKVLEPTPPSPILRRVASRQLMSEALPEPMPAHPAATAAGERSQWERIALAPDIELHVRRPLSRIQNKRVDRLLTIAREILEEEPS